MVEVGFLADFANNYIFLNIKCQGQVILKKIQSSQFFELFRDNIMINAVMRFRILNRIREQHFANSDPDPGATFC